MEFSAVKMTIVVVTYTKPQPFYLHLFFKRRELGCQEASAWFIFQTTSLSWPVLQTYPGAVPKHALKHVLKLSPFKESCLISWDLSEALSTACCIFPAHKAFHWPTLNSQPRKDWWLLLKQVSFMTFLLLNRFALFTSFFSYAYAAFYIYSYAQE